MEKLESSQVFEPGLWPVLFLQAKATYPKSKILKKTYCLYMHEYSNGKTKAQDFSFSKLAQTFLTL